MRAPSPARVAFPTTLGPTARPPGRTVTTVGSDPEGRDHVGLEAPARRERDPAAQLEHVLAGRQRLDLFDPIDPHDRGTVDTDEARRIELLFHGAHRLA